MLLYTDNMMAPRLLQSKDHGELLNVIDILRSIRLNHYVPIPQIIVCGDQSSGKSEVLNAVSTIHFPAKDNLCTRFATELILRRGPMTSATVAIIPGDGRTQDERDRLLAFKTPTVNINEFGSVVDAAKEAMGLDSDTKAFTDDILRVEITGPDQPNLTLVDLPGVIHSENKQQSTNDVELVSSLVRSYMSNSRSIILAVVSAKNDYANQVITRLAREVDPKGVRTLGIITKPDTLHPGSDSELAFANLARNEDVIFRLGWHVLRNRDYDTRDCSAAERDQNEKCFFSQGIWTSLPANILGIGSLRPRLSTVLKDQVMLELPSLIRDVKSGINDCQNAFDRLGEARGTLQEQQHYLIRASRSFSVVVKAAVDGSYVDEFFGKARSNSGYSKRLRAVLQNILLEFADEIRTDGQHMKIVEKITPEDAERIPKRISRSEYINNVRELMRNSRGCELPGTFNPLIIGDLFYEQARPWKALLERYSRRILDAVRKCIRLILDHVTDESTSAGLLREVIDPVLEKRTKQLRDKVAEIMRPYQKGHPITYNHYFTETIQKARKDHGKREQHRRLNVFFKMNPDSEPYALSSKQVFNTGDLINALHAGSEADMDRFACSEAVYCMEAYYKVAMKVIVDNFATLGIEYCILSKLADIFSPDTVMNMNEDLMSRIATETEDSSIERDRATKKLNTLREGLQTLGRLSRQKQSIVCDTESSSENNTREDNESIHETEDADRRDSEYEEIRADLSVQAASCIWGPKPPLELCASKEHRQNTHSFGF